MLTELGKGIDEHRGKFNKELENIKRAPVEMDFFISLLWRGGKNTQKNCSKKIFTFFFFYFIFKLLFYF